MSDTQEITEFDLSMLESLDFEPDNHCESNICQEQGRGMHSAEWIWLDRCVCSDGGIVCTWRKNLEHREMEFAVRKWGRPGPCAVCQTPVNPNSTFLPLGSKKL